MTHGGRPASEYEVHSATFDDELGKSSVAVSKGVTSALEQDMMVMRIREQEAHKNPASFLTNLWEPGVVASLTFS